MQWIAIDQVLIKKTREVFLEASMKKEEQKATTLGTTIATTATAITPTSAYETSFPRFLSYCLLLFCQPPTEKLSFLTNLFLNLTTNQLEKENFIAKNRGALEHWVW